MLTACTIAAQFPGGACPDSSCRPAQASRHVRTGQYQTRVRAAVRRASGVASRSGREHRLLHREASGGKEGVTLDNHSAAEHWTSRL